MYDSQTCQSPSVDVVQRMYYYDVSLHGYTPRFKLLPSHEDAISKKCPLRGAIIGGRRLNQVTRLAASLHDPPYKLLFNKISHGGTQIAQKKTWGVHSHADAKTWAPKKVGSNSSKWIGHTRYSTVEPSRTNTPNDPYRKRCIFFFLIVLRSVRLRSTNCQGRAHVVLGLWVPGVIFCLLSPLKPGGLRELIG